MSLILAMALCTAYDGDTLRCGRERVRLSNIDAPELRGSPRCHRSRYGKNPSWCDYALGLRSRNALRAFIRSGNLTVHRQGRDHYGRTLARVTVNGQDAGQHLIRLGLARPWR